MSDVDTTLAERGAQYGKFIDQSHISESLKEIMHSSPSWPSMLSDQREALDMIAVKIARLLNGNPHHLDSYIDVAGYATLVAKRLQGVEV